MSFWVEIYEEHEESRNDYKDVVIRRKRYDGPFDTYEAAKYYIANSSIDDPVILDFGGR